MIRFHWPGQPVWTGWQKWLFRFLLIYFLLYIAPWTWISLIPYGEVLLQPYYTVTDWLVRAANQWIFRRWDELVPINGSGDTSFAWTQLWLYLSLSAVIALIWSIFSRRSRHYNGLAYWMRQILRYTVAMNCFGYGIIKLFGLQMYYPSLSQLATPLGDFLPMRLSWMFMGYSFTYQAFSGVMEVVAGLLLLYRRTATAGVLLAMGVFVNVMMLNFSFDIPVKLFSAHLVLMCVVLLGFEYRRLAAFLTGQPADSSQSYQFSFPARWMRITRIILKLAFVVLVIALPFRDSYERYQQLQAGEPEGRIRRGIYEVTSFVVNGDTLPPSLSNEARWSDMIFDYNGVGSVATSDSIFRQRYHRGYFNYRVDSTGGSVAFTRSSVTGEMTDLFTLALNVPDSVHLQLSGRIRRDSVALELRRLPRHFQLTENQFHWLSEYNR